MRAINAAEESHEQNKHWMGESFSVWSEKSEGVFW